MSSRRIDTAIDTPRLVITIGPEGGLPDAVELMRRHAIRHLVVTQNGKIMGMLDNRDILERGFAADGQRLDPERHVRDVMTPLTASLSEKTTLSDAMERMTKEAVTAMPVTNNTGMIGIVTESDLLKVLVKMLQEDNPHGFAERTKILLSHPVLQGVAHLISEAGI